jgi:hypothetical protein
MRVEIDLAVGDRDVGADVTGLGLGDRQCRQRAAATVGRKLRRTLQEA